MVLHFFGLTPEYRLPLFQQIHEIVFKGGGGYDYQTVYEMPIWLRVFTFKMLKEHYERENEAVNKSTPLGPGIDAEGAYKAKFKR